MKHLQRYLDEFTLRFNNRKTEDLFGLVIMNPVIGTANKYAELTERAEEPKDDGPEPYFRPALFL